jgi:hypothetical protein
MYVQLLKYSMAQCMSWKGGCSRRVEVLLRINRVLEVLGNHQVPVPKKRRLHLDQKLAQRH